MRYQNVKKSRMMKRLALVITMMSTLFTMSFTKYAKGSEEPVATKASYYSSSHHGGKTASGVTFLNTALTAAHRTLPFGTKVKVRNVKNGNEVVVTINDRGPFIKGRQLDLSQAAFKQLASLDAGVVSIEYSVVP